MPHFPLSGKEKGPLFAEDRIRVYTMPRRNTMYKKTLLTAFIILGVFLCGNAIAGTKFINKDTAKDRKPVRMGTGGGNKSQISIQSDNNSNTIRVSPKKDDEDKEDTQVGPIFVVPEIKP